MARKLKPYTCIFFKKHIKGQTIGERKQQDPFLAIIVALAVINEEVIRSFGSQGRTF